MNTYQTADRPDPRIRSELVAEVTALYTQTCAHGQGKLLFVAGELGSGRSMTLHKIADTLRDAKPKPIIIRTDLGTNATKVESNQLPPMFAELIGQILPLTTMVSDPLTATIVNFVGQLLQASASAHAIALEIGQRRDPLNHGLDPELLKRLLRRTALDKPVICLFDHFDQAIGSWWHQFLLTFATEIAAAPLLFMLSVDGPAQLTAPDEDASALLGVAHRLCIERQLAEWHYLPALTLEQVTAWVGKADPQLPAQLYTITSGNPTWLKELWADWWEQGLLAAPFETLRWRFVQDYGPEQLGTIKDICERRLRVLLPDDPLLLDKTLEILAIATLEGHTFTPAALAKVIGWDAEELLDFLDDHLLQEADRPYGLLQEISPLTVNHSNAITKRTLYRYEFTAHLFWITLHHYGFTPVERKTKSLALAHAIIALYQPEERQFANLLAKLFHTGGATEKAQHYQKMADYAAHRTVLRAQAFQIISAMSSSWKEWDTLELTHSAEVLLEAGDAMLNAYPYSETLIVYEAAHKIASYLTLRSVIARATYGQGSAHLAAGQYRQAQTFFEAALPLCQALRSRRGEGACLGDLGTVYHQLGQVEQAITAYEQALTIARTIDDRDNEGIWLGNLGGVYHQLGQVEQAITAYEQALTIARTIGDRQAEGTWLGNLGRGYHQLGQVEQAITAYEQALTIARTIDDRYGEGTCLGNLGGVYHQLGQVEQAITAYEQALTITRTIGDRYGEGACLGNLGRVYHELGQVEQAITAYEQALTIARTIGERLGEGAWLANLGGAYHDLGHMLQARQAWEEALHIFKEIKSPIAAQVRNWLDSLNST